MKFKYQLKHKDPIIDGIFKQCFQNPLFMSSPLSMSTLMFSPVSMSFFQHLLASYNKKTIYEEESLWKDFDVINFDDVEPLQKVDHQATIDMEYVCDIYHIYDIYDNEYKHIFCIYEVDPYDTINTEYTYDDDDDDEDGRDH